MDSHRKSVELYSEGLEKQLDEDMERSLAEDVATDDHNADHNADKKCGASTQTEGADAAVTQSGSHTGVAGMMVNYASSTALSVREEREHEAIVDSATNPPPGTCLLM